MLRIIPPDYKFCPFCGDPLGSKELEGIPRKFCPKDNWIYFPHVPTSSAAVIKRDDEFFLVQRNREPYKGKWMFPAGFISYGEHPKEAAVREALEETGYPVNNPKFIDVLQVTDDPREPGHFIFFYEVDLIQEDRGEILDKEENQSMGWFKFSNLPEIAFQSQQEIIKRLLQE